MAEPTPASNVEDPKSFPTRVSRWEAELASSEKALKNWRETCKRIDRRYSLEMDGMGDVFGMDRSKFNILWSNVQTLKPGVYGREPVPVVKRRHRDQDIVGRIAAQVLERAVITEMERNERLGRGLDSTLKRALQDFLLFGRGVAWARYEPDIEGDTVLGESCVVDYVNRNDFLHSPKATWAETVKDGWVARRVSMTKRQGTARFGDVFDAVPLTVGDGSDDLDERDAETIGRADVWEIWDAATRRVIWINRDMTSRVLDERDDYLGFEGFFPCPMPAYGTVSNDRMVPVPDFSQYEKLAEELDEQTDKIDNLTSALNAKGFYDGSIEGLQSLLESGDDKLVPVAGMTELFGKGSSGGTVTSVVQYLPLETIARALIGLYDARDRTKQTLYEVSGIADVMRGAVDPREKLGQSQIKERNAGQRIDVKRDEMEKLARSCIRRIAECVCEHYDPDRIRQLSGFDRMPEVVEIAGTQGPEAVEMAFAECVRMLRDDRLRGFRLEIETRSTMLEDDQEEREGRIEFLQAAGEFIGSSVQVVQQVPSLAPLMGQMMLFGVRGFRAGRQIESAFEDAVEAISPQEDQAAQEGEANAQAEREAAIAQEQAQMEMQSKQADIEGKMAVAQSNAQAKQADAQIKMQVMQAKAEMDLQKAQLEMEKMQAEHAIAMRNMEMELARSQAELQLKEREAMVGVAVDRQKSENAMKLAQETAKNRKVRE